MPLHWAALQAAHSLPARGGYGIIPEPGVLQRIGCEDAGVTESTSVSLILVGPLPGGDVVMVVISLPGRCLHLLDEIHPVRCW